MTVYDLDTVHGRAHSASFARNDHGAKRGAAGAASDVPSYEPADGWGSSCFEVEMSLEEKRSRPRPRGPEVGRPALGLDVGGVLVDRVAEESDTSFFGSRPMDTPAMPGAFAAVAALCSGPFECRVYLVSKAGPKIATLTQEWLGRTGFFESTGVSAGNLHFVRRRPDKGPVCASLGITHFVDDRIDVLLNLGSVQQRFLFLGGLGPNPRPPAVPDGLTTAEDWPALQRLISATL